MRHLRENNPPLALIACIANRNKAGQAIDYDEAGQIEINGETVSVTAEVRKARIRDQGGICAYTMMRIDENNCHNEHLIPRAVSKASGNIAQTLEYRNIVACYPKSESDGPCDFGAIARGVKELAVTPLDTTCESRIRFDRKSGDAVPSNPSDVEIQRLIDEVLVLNHATLKSRRLGAIENADVGIKSRNPLSAGKAKLLAVDILERKNGKNLAPYCVAIAHAAIAHATLIEKRKKLKIRNTNI